MYTIDARVHVSALNPREPESGASRAFLALVRRQRLPLFCPTLLTVEIAAALARVFEDYARALELAAILRQLPGQTLVPLDESLADLAVGLAAQYRLRGADAVYAAVALHSGSTLVTLDREQRERLPAVITTRRPAEVLAEWEMD
jgi:predicted nucleic acid-binding protein